MPARAQSPKAEESEELLEIHYRTVTTKEGLSFRVPEDMPIETRNGIVAPIPFEEYVYAKFQQIDGRLRKISTKLDEIEKILIFLKESRSTARGKKPVSESVSQGPQP